MKIAVLIPSDEYRGFAGARIRYGRIAPVLAASGTEMVLHDIAEFDPLTNQPDVLIISKCHDSRALLAAALLGGRGCVVGVDLFDDYFSQREDARLARFRNWLRQLLGMCDFATCSTQAMAGVVAGYRENLPVHVMNDPAGSFDLAGLPVVLARKRAEVLASRRMTLAWFGVGDNPNFPIGLHDLVGYAGVLPRLAAAGYDVQLRIMTNPRALSARGLTQIGQLPIRSEVLEWSEQGEQELLAEAFAAFLPVNQQPFSRAKSLNRAVTALTAGCQVLSTGYPLYEQLCDLIYRDPDRLVTDLEDGTLKLSSDRMDSFTTAMMEFASAETEAAHLLSFLKAIKPGTRVQGTLTLIHGVATNGAAHKMVRAANGLSVASPFCNTPLGFDVIFRGRGNGMTMWVSDKIKGRLVGDSGVGLGTPSVIDGKKFLEVRHAAQTGEKSARTFLDWQQAGLPFQVATYPAVMSEIEVRMNEAFGPCHTIISESAQLPLARAA